MTRSPILSTLIPLVPLAALGNQADYKATAPEKIENKAIVSADLFAKSAHPFSELSVTIAGATWTFAPDEELQEINFPQGDEVTLQVSITWPEGTPETAALLTLQAEGKEDRTHTLWGSGEVTEEITFNWKEPK